MSIAEAYPIAADEKDKKATKLIAKWYRAKVWRDIVRETFRFRKFKRAYSAHLLGHLIGCVLIALCRNVTIAYGNVPATFCVSWLVAAVIISAFWPLIRLLYWETAFTWFEDKYKQAVGDHRILLIERQRY